MCVHVTKWHPAQGGAVYDRRMTAVHTVVGTIVLVLSLAAGLYGAWAWWRAEPAPRFWPLLRASQIAIVVQVVIGVVLLTTGHEPPSLHLLYGLLPVAISFVAEQLRLAAADQVLVKRDLDSAREIEGLPLDEQRAIVMEIVRRETGVMAASALVVFFLALRAAGVAGFVV
jgi:hypothetical protein